MKFTAPLRAGDNNLFDEGLFKKSEATKFKKELALRMKDRMEVLKLDIRAAAVKADCTQADIKRLRKGEVAGYGLEELVGLARHFGLRIQIQVERPDVSKKSLH
jgi:predicted XRE-type DNA-binding protein